MNYNLQNQYICSKSNKMAKITLTPLEINQLLDNYKSELRKLEFQVEAAKSAIAQLEGAPVSPATITAPPEEKKSEPKKRGPKPKNKETQAVPVVAAPIEKPSESEAPKKRGPKAKTINVTEPKAAKTKAAKAPKAEKPAKAEKITKATKEAKALKVEKPAKSKAPAAAPVAETKTPARKGRPSTKKAGEPKAPAAEQKKKAKPGPTASYSEWDTFILETMKRVGKPMANADLLDYMKTERDARKNEKEYQIGDSRLKELLNRSLQKLGNKMALLVKENYEGRGFLYRLK